ncbi:MAG: acyl-homoserine-lactone synthase [Gammaproteobacteria bacterium]
MRQILMGKASDKNMEWTALRGMFRLRHTVFYQRLRWDVKSVGDLERDDYDDLAPVYLVSRDHQRRVDGCLRLFPTTGSYMLKERYFSGVVAGRSGPFRSAGMGAESLYGHTELWGGLSAGKFEQCCLRYDATFV